MIGRTFSVMQSDTDYATDGLRGICLVLSTGGCVVQDVCMEYGQYFIRGVCLVHGT